MNGMEKSNFNYKIIEGLPSSSELIQLEKLYNTIFEDAQISFFQNRILSKEHLCFIIALKNEKFVGFKIGYNYNKTTFYSWIGGVLSNERNKGIGKKLAQLQEEWAKKNNYFKIITKSMNHFKPMLILNFKNGFNIISVYNNRSNQTKIVFEKELN